MMRMTGRPPFFHRSFLALVATCALVAPGVLVQGAAAVPTRLASTTVESAMLDPELVKAFDTADRAQFWVDLKADADLAAASNSRSWSRRGAEVVARLRSTARQAQVGIRDVLDRSGATYQPFWISNAVLVTGTRQLAEELSARPDVAGVRPTRTYRVPEPTMSQRRMAAQALAWNIEQVRADEVWSEYGVRGEGVVVANIDTGVDLNHPALVRQYRGNNRDGTFDHEYNWFDPSEVCGDPSLEPCDNHGHGTHTMGTMLGDDGENVVGVAPHATWIAAKGCETGECSDVALLSSAQWMLAPTDLDGGNPRPDLRPHVINNSWGTDGHDPLFADAVGAWVAAGIFPVFSAGNNGPGCGTVGSPGDYDTAYSVGSHNRNGSISSFSSRGPGTATESIDPDITAPGASITSSVPGGGYGSASGTSMAAPHAAGTVALMWSAAPALRRDITGTRQLLDHSAIDVADLSCGGGASDNNVWGEGKLDTMLAVTAAPRGATGELSGTVTDATTGEPLPGVQIDLTRDLTRTVRTGADGTYTVELAAGSYDLSATIFGYEAATVPDVEVTPDSATVSDIELTPAASYALTGVVTDPAGAPVVGTTVQLPGTPIPEVTTGGQGRYRFAQVPAGSYDIRVTGSGCLGAVTQPVTVAADTTVDFSLDRPSDAFGYQCEERPSSYLLPTTEVPLEARTARLELPFPFTFYGETYKAVNIAEPGFVNFGRSHPAVRNVQLPYGDWPNASVYPMWDDIVVDSSAQVYTGTYGEAPNRRMVIEWRNVTFWRAADDVRFDVEVILHENGDIVTQYRGLDTERERGGSATVGIENANGTVGFQYSYNKPVLRGSAAIAFVRPPNGFASGVVTDANDRTPIRGAQVTISADGAVLREGLTDGQGRFKLEVPLGTYEVEITSPRYATSSQTLVVDQNDEYVEAGAALPSPRADVDTGLHTVVVPEGEVRTRTLTIGNTGGVDLRWELAESAGAGAGSPFSAADGPTVTATGDLIRRWQLEDRPDLFGVSTDGEGQVWLGGEAIQETNTEYETDGTPTGRRWSTEPHGRTWAADMAYDARRGNMCQVAIGGGDDGISCWDPDTGQVTAAIRGDLPWTQISQRGLAYRPDDDTFYVGGPFDSTIFHVAGLSHGAPGTVLSSCQPEDPFISGLGWNAATGTLWVATNGPDDTVFQVDPTNCETISTLPHPRPGRHAGGLEVDEVGNLWMVDTDEQIAYLFDSGTSALIDVPWLTVSGAGRVAPGESAQASFTVDTTGLEPGVHDASILLASDNGRDPYIRVPVRVVVPKLQVGVNVGGGEYVDADGDRWRADQRHDGDWGRLGRSHPRTSVRSIAGTDEDALYQSRRDGEFRYRFDDLPVGTYLVDLRFAEFIPEPKPDKRLFDVTINGRPVLPRHDVASEVGGLTADVHTFEMQHDGGDLIIELVGRRSYQQPILNALRVTERPDL